MVTKVEKVVYRAHATSTGGRDGTSKTSDGLLNVKLTVQVAVSIRSNCLPQATARASLVP